MQFVDKVYVFAYMTSADAVIPSMGGTFSSPHFTTLYSLTKPTNQRPVSSHVIEPAASRAVPASSSFQCRKSSPQCRKYILRFQSLAVIGSFVGWGVGYSVNFAPCA